MSKAKKLLLIFVTAVLLTLAALLISCGNDGIEKLPAPTGLEISDSDILTWNEVENAQSYVVELDGEEYETKENSLDIFLLTTQIKTYSIKVMAIGDWERYDDSDWSDNLEYNISDFYLNGLGFSEPAGGAVTVSVAIPSYIVGKVIIPSKIGEYTVTGIDDFMNCSKMTSVIIPDTVTGYVGGFSQCTSLKRVKLPTGITEIHSFNNTAISEIDIPNTVEKIASGAFSGCKSLTSIELPDSLGIIGASAFSQCENLETVKWPEQLYKIDIYAFGGCRKLKNIHLPAHVTKLTIDVFQSCYDLTEITVDARNEVFIGEGNCIIEKESGKLILGGNNSVIPDYVKTIGRAAFNFRQNISVLDIPNGVETLEDRSCASLPNLKKIRLPATIKYAEEAFAECPNVETIYVDDGNEVYVDDGNCLINKQTKSVRFGCKNSVIPEGIRQINSMAFFGCAALTEINIPASVMEIGPYAFYGASLKSITIPYGVEIIGSGAFSGVTVYTPYTEKQVGWAGVGVNGSSVTNPSFIVSTIIFGCDVIDNENESYIYSFVFTDNVRYMYAPSADSDKILDIYTNPRIPTRSGYTFKGWTTQEGGTEAEYNVYNIGNDVFAALSKTERDSIPEGTYLYAIWEENK